MSGSKVAVQFLINHVLETHCSTMDCAVDVFLNFLSHVHALTRSTLGHVRFDFELILLRECWSTILGLVVRIWLWLVLRVFLFIRWLNSRYRSSRSRFWSFRSEWWSSSSDHGTFGCCGAVAWHRGSTRFDCSITIWVYRVISLVLQWSAFYHLNFICNYKAITDLMIWAFL